MPALTKFQGHLLHPYYVEEEFPDEEVINTADADNSHDIVIMPDAMLTPCGGCRVLPILKAVDLKVIESKDLQLSVNLDGVWQTTFDLFNAKTTHQDPTNQISRGMYFTKDKNDIDQTSVVISTPIQTNYGVDGVLLSPTISIRSNMSNNSGGAIAAESFDIAGYLDIDWVEVSNAEFEEYLKELFFLQAIGLEG